MRLIICVMLAFSLTACDYVTQSFEDKVPITLEVDSNALVQSRLGYLREDIQVFLDRRKIRYLSLQEHENTILIKYRHDPKPDLFAELKKRFIGLSIDKTDEPVESENRQVVISVPDKTRTEFIRAGRRQNRAVIHNLLEDKGIKAEIKNIGIDRIKVLIPESKYSDDLIASLTHDENLAFYLVAINGDSDTMKLDYKIGKAVNLVIPSLITSSNITYATASMEGANKQPALKITLDSVGARIMKRTTSEHLGRQMAVVMVNKRYSVSGGQAAQQLKVISIATIQGVFGKRFMITGLDSMKEAEQLAEHLRAGVFAAPIKLVSEATFPKQSGSGRDKNGGRGE